MMFFDYQTHYKSLDNGENADPETVDMILQGFADFAENVLAPLYQPADEEGCHLKMVWSLRLKVLKKLMTSSSKAAGKVFRTLKSTAV